LLKFSLDPFHFTRCAFGGQIIGDGHLFQSSRFGALVSEDIAVAQALADVATIGWHSAEQSTSTQCQMS
jgi:hypothetical protein